MADFSVVGSIFSLEISDHYAAWVGTDAKKVYAWVCVYDLRTGRVRKAGEIRPEWYFTGGVDRVRVSGDTLIYQEKKEVLSDYGPARPVAWAIWSVDLNTGEKRKIAGSSNALEEKVSPGFAVEWPWVLLGGFFFMVQEDNPEAKWHLYAYDLRNHKKQLLIPNLDDGSMSIDRGMVFYSVFSADNPRDDSTWRTDLFMVPVERSAPSTQITHNRKPGWPEAESGAVTWQEGTPSTPTSRTTPWLQFIGSNEPPIQLAEEGNNVQPGDGFALWLGPPTAGFEGSTLYARDPLSPDPPIPLAQYLNIPARWRTHGQLAIWATYNKDWPAHDKNDDPYVIHVVRITKS